MGEQITPTIITKYTMDDIRKRFFHYELLCKSRQDAQLMKQLYKDLIVMLHLEAGKTYSSMPHKEEEK